MPQTRKKCFIAMPITTHDHEVDRYRDKLHWKHVMDSLFTKAIEAAGYEAIPPIAQGSHLIHEVIIKNLEKSDLVLCDLSGHNPNVFFELGVRTSLNKPIALVRDEFTSIPFDTGGINIHTYKSTLHGWDMEDEQEGLRLHLVNCAASCRGRNPLWHKFGLTLKAQEPQTEETPFEAKLDLLTSRLPELEDRLADEKHRSETLQAELIGLRYENRNLIERLLDAGYRITVDTDAFPSDSVGDVGLFSAAVSRYAEKAGLDISVAPKAKGRRAVVSFRGPHEARAEARHRIENFAVRFHVPMQWIEDDSSTVFERTDVRHNPSVRRPRSAPDSERTRHGYGRADSSDV